MTDDDPLARFRVRVQALHARLESADPRAEHDRTWLRDEIVALGRDLERTIRDLDGLKVDVQPLVERYRERFARTAAAPPVQRVDHLASATYRERGWSALAGGEYERALEQLRRAVEMDPQEPSSLVLLAWAHLRLGGIREARALLAEALRLDPTNPLGLTVRAAADIEVGRYQDAIDTLSAVLHQGGDRTADLYARLHLGRACARIGRYPEGAAALRRALEVAPNFTEACWELGLLHRAEGRLDLALEAWRAGRENRFSSWGERCGDAIDRFFPSSQPG